MTKSEEWECAPFRHVSHWPGSSRWPAPSGRVTLWCTDCGGYRPHVRVEKLREE